MIEAPSADELQKDPIVRAAWADSFPDDPQLRHEEGGFIYYNPIAGGITVRRTPPGGRNSLNLSFPPSVHDSFLIAMYHTHPTPPGRRVTAEPSSLDWKYAIESGVPWFIISHEGVYIAGPDRRVGGCIGNPLYPID